MLQRGSGSDHGNFSGELAPLWPWLSGDKHGRAATNPVHQLPVGLQASEGSVFGSKVKRTLYHTGLHGIGRKTEGHL